jgi:regulatory protein
METKSRRKPPQKRRLPRQATASYLENAALHYLERFSSSSANLRRVLMRKVARSARAHGTDAAEGANLVEAIIARYLQSGLLDDAAYAAQKAASLRRRGTSRYGIRGKLAVKGVDAELIDAALERLDDERGAGDLAAACALARRRRLGPYRPREERAARRQKDLAALARAGFSLDVARRVLAAADVDAIEALARDGDAPA